MSRPTLTPEERRLRNAAKQAARRAAMTREERATYVVYQRQKNAEYRARHRQRLRANVRQKRLDHGEEIRVAERQRRQAHPGQYSARNGAWNKAHPEQCRVACKKWRAANPAKVKAANDKRPKPLPRTPGYDRRYYILNIEAICARVRSWAQANPELKRIQRARRRAMRANAPRADLTHAQWVAIQEAQDHCCAYCGKRCKGKLTQDHITPLSKGGSHTLHNVIGACTSCNSRKHTGPPLQAVQPLLL